MPNDHKIYILINPKNKAVFYVGRTRNCINIRISAHICSAKRGTKNPSLYSEMTVKKNALIKSIVDSGKTPIIKVIMTTSSDRASYWERHMYTKYLNSGAKLLQLPIKSYPIYMHTKQFYINP